MSLTENAYESRKWRSLKILRTALVGKELSEHRCLSSVAYSQTESVSDLLEISLLLLENIREIPSDVSGQTSREIKALSNELRETADRFLELSDRLEKAADQACRA